MVCAYNSSDYIESTLQALIDLSYPNGKYEVIVVNDDSSDNTAEIVRRFKTVRLVNHRTNEGVSAARNSGLKAARGKWLAFIDDDCVADKRWLSLLLRELQKPQVIGAGGLIKPHSTRHVLQRYLFSAGYGRPATLAEGLATNIFARLLSYVRSQFAHAFGEVVASEVFEVYGANSAFHTQSLRLIGGFDAQLQSSEDSDICRRLHEWSPYGSIRFNPDAVVYHRYTGSLISYLAKLFKRQRDTLDYYTRQGKFPPLYPMPLVFCLLVAASICISWQLALSTLVVSPLILYGWWLVGALKAVRPELLLYPYIQLSEECVRLGGLFVAAVKVQSP